MSIINPKQDRKKDSTRFYHAEHGGLLARLDVRLDRDDWERLQVLFNFIYNRGVEHGSTARAKEIRVALGIEVEE
ncbi:hypothetical protein [Citrobacter portucalensis]|uniref:hypothetical protein n=1 Tax=Citrobacter portucalensis TaxID=1639133 RepID=UPI00226B6937|nr:hypothetical protein [Citrobacter portucalensis]MCX8985114.1 hypothetical protein [Citrobacter portucalensis]